MPKKNRNTAKNMAIRDLMKETDKDNLFVIGKRERSFLEANRMVFEHESFEAEDLL